MKALLAWLVSAAALAAHGEETPDAALVARVLRHSPLLPPPPDPTNRQADSEDAALLGRALFFEKGLSRNGAIACASCHDPARAFTDGRGVSVGLATNARNAPSLFNVAQQRWYFWDGRADSLWSQALQPLEGAAEMGGDRVTITRFVARDVGLRAAYERAFGALDESGPTPEDVPRVFVNLGKALAAYERRLVSADSPFDRFAAALRAGDDAAQQVLGERARRGLLLFVGRADCHRCHAGPLFSDGEFHSIGLPGPDGKAPRDPGRRAGIEILRRDPFRGAGEHSDDPRGARAREIEDLALGVEQWGQFKTPSLRNVAITAPYMHAGQLATLDDVLRFYSTREGAVPAGHHGEQVLAPLHLAPSEILDLRAFLESLTDDSLAQELRRAPERSELTRSSAAR